jgi:secreted PhoX family phosphatase
MASAVPLKAMGRFNHEAVAVDPASGIVYQTEDREDGLFYRFIPKERTNLRAGGMLQALKIRDLSEADTANRTRKRIPIGLKLDAEWVDLENVESPGDDLRHQGRSLGAALFSRGEGIWMGQGVLYFACTSGGPNAAGQIWRYSPEGKLELFVEPNETSLLENVDNLTVAPWGDLFVCEDGPGVNRVVGITPNGRLYPFAQNVMNDSEMAGAVFSPNGTTLFVNIQRPGMTLAITGPWRT